MTITWFLLPCVLVKTKQQYKQASQAVQVRLTCTCTASGTGQLKITGFLFAMRQACPEQRMVEHQISSKLSYLLMIPKNVSAFFFSAHN